MAGPARLEQHGRIGFLDDGGAGDGRGAEILAVPDGNVRPGARKEDLAAGLRLGRRGEALQRPGLGLGELAYGGGTQRDDFDGRAAVGVGEALLVEGVETFDQRIERRLIERRLAVGGLRRGHGQLEGLALVAHVGGELEQLVLGADGVGVEARLAFGEQALGHLGQVRKVRARRLQ